MARTRRSGSAEAKRRNRSRSPAKRDAKKSSRDRSRDRRKARSSSSSSSSSARKGRRRSPSRKKKTGSDKKAPARSSPARKRSRSRNAQQKKAADARQRSSSSSSGKPRRSPSLKKGVSGETPAAGDAVNGHPPAGTEGDADDRHPATVADGPGETAGADEMREASPDKPKVDKISVTLTLKPFGMAPSKEPGTCGYVVAKVAEGKPAESAGVQVGWRVVDVAGTDCEDKDAESVQAMLKAAPVPVIVVFEKPKEGGDDDEDSDEDIMDSRAQQREANAETMQNIDELPVERHPADLPEPIKNWQDAMARGFLNKPLMDKLQAAGLKRPTVIQRHALPIIQNGNYDLIAMAQTGSGKTFGFVIPTVCRLLLQGCPPRPFFPGKSPTTPLVLVLSPTRELAMQTHKEIEVLAKGTTLSSVCIFGGETLKFQTQRIEKSQIDVCCATPGRLIDLIDGGTISLSFVQSVILDEADQMLEQSLEVMCAEILTGRDMPEPANRQTLLFSATMPPKIRELCPQILRQDRIANLTIGHYGDDQGGSCASIKQILRWVPDETQRGFALVDDLRRLWIAPGKNGRIVIFTNQRVQASNLAKMLESQGIPCLHLHGKLEQHVREEVFTKFRKGQADVLVATNVASRGLDFADISMVVQLNLPATIDIYTHRIGRTGRVGQVGASLAYMGPKDRHLAPKLVDFLHLNNQEVPDFLQQSRPRRGRSPPRYRGRH